MLHGPFGVVYPQKRKEIADELQLFRQQLQSARAGKEIALALDARSALSMRKRGAKPTPPKAVKEASAVSRKWRKIAGIAVMVLGGALLLYVTSMVQRSKPLQIAGFLLLGVGLMVMRSGAPAGEAHASPRSLQKAQRLLAALRQNNFVNGLNVRFDDEKMTIATKSKNVDVPYPELHSVVETEHMWFVTYGQAGVVLQKARSDRGISGGVPVRHCRCLWLLDGADRMDRGNNRRKRRRSAVRRRV